MSFDQQIAQIRADLTERHWGSGSALVAHSYGGHLCLSALADLPPFPGSRAVVSPAFQSVRHEFNYYRVPNARSLMRVIENQTFPVPVGAVGIVSGRSDWQVPAPGLERLAQTLGVEVQWADRGHDLGPDPVQALLDQLNL